MPFRTVREATAALRQQGWAVTAEHARPWFGAASYRVEAVRGVSRHSIESPSVAEVLAVVSGILARDRPRVAVA